MEHWKNLSLKTLPGEKWKDVEDHKGLYKVSNLGRLKSLSKPFFGKTGSKKNRGIAPVKIISQNLGTTKGKEYLRVGLSLNYKSKHYSLHRLVAKAFIPNPENKPEVNHKNGIKTDNRVKNLEWATTSENQKHSFKIGLSTPNTTNMNVRGCKHGRTNLTEKDVYEIRKRYDAGERLIMIWKDYDHLASHSTICGIGLRKNWKYLKEI